MKKIRTSDTILLRCPFCGELPEQTIYGDFVRCFAQTRKALRKDCALSISNIWFTKKQWNKRAK